MGASKKRRRRRRVAPAVARRKESATAAPVVRRQAEADAAVTRDCETEGWKDVRIQVFIAQDTTPVKIPFFGVIEKPRSLHRDYEANLKDRIKSAQTALQDCCVNLVEANEWKTIEMSHIVEYGERGDDGKPVYSQEIRDVGAEAAKETEAIPLILVDELEGDAVTGIGDGRTFSDLYDRSYTGPAMFMVEDDPEWNVKSVIAHELWHVAGADTHPQDVEGSLESGDGKLATDRYCERIRKNL